VGNVVVAVAVSFATIFVAELGDKSQLLVLALATRLRPVPLLVGLVAVTAVLQAIAVGVGALLRFTLPERPITVGAGVVFVLFGVWSLRRGPDEPQPDERTARSQGSALAAALGAFFVAELGDKTQLAALTLAARYPAVGVWIGATLGMSAALAVALVVGRVLGAKLPEQAVRLLAGTLFLVIGAALIVSGLRA
jgi:putative Ca2+/H+ antiporter (TMEM165/GDT1 family)